LLSRDNYESVDGNKVIVAVVIYKTGF